MKVDVNIPVLEATARIYVQELAGAIHPASLPEKRRIVLFKFYCDESYDGAANPEPRTYVVAGFFSDEQTWTDVEKRWVAVNADFGIQRFHASHLNGKTYEYEGWDDDKKISYSAELLKIITDQGRRIHAFTCGMLADRYSEIISGQGREKLGHPYCACFKSCIALVAKEMQAFSPNDKFSVILDRNRFEGEAVKAFYEMKESADFAYSSRLATCTPASMDEFIALQSADLIAYEVFKRLHIGRDSTGAVEMRRAFSLLVDHIGYDGGNYFSGKTLLGLKAGIEGAVCGPNKLIVIPT